MDEVLDGNIDVMKKIMHIVNKYMIRRSTLLLTTESILG